MRTEPDNKFFTRERLLPGSVLLTALIFAGAAFVIGIIGALLRSDPIGNVIASAFEAAILAFIGGLLARSFISLLLWTGREHPNVALLIGWGFFLWPGVIDTIARIFGKQAFLTRPTILLWIAMSIGSFTGMMDGLWQTHQWIGIGLPSYVLDETWGLNGTTQGTILHLFDIIGGDHAVGEIRTEAHRYQQGFAFVPNSALTLGAVMSSNTDPVGSAVFAHETTHIWQNRLLGPFYILTYIAWLIFWLIPGLVYGLISGSGAGVGIQAWSYFNNPWEAMGYDVGTSRGDLPRDDPLRGPGIWPDPAVYIVGILFYAACAYIAYRLIRRTWHNARANP